VPCNRPANKSYLCMIAALTAEQVALLRRAIQGIDLAESNQSARTEIIEADLLCDVRLLQRSGYKKFSITALGEKMLEQADARTRDGEASSGS
jgi:hypothetical protein